MRARIRAALAALAGLGLAFAVAGPVHAAYDVGAHLHVEVGNHPTDGHPIPKAPYTFHVTLKLHDQPGATTYLRIDDSSTTRAKIALKLGPAGDLAYSFDWTVDFSSWSTGRHELRWHLDVPSNPDGKRQFTTSRAPLCIVSCSPNVGGRATPFLGGGSWYSGNTYVVALLLSPLTDLRPGGTIVVRSQYSRSKALCVFANPDFHHGIRGTTLACFGGGTGNHTVSLAGTSVGDRLIIWSSDGNEAGVLQLFVGDGTDQATTFMGFQSWWSKAGLVLP